jgi:hypothetical protein
LVSTKGDLERDEDVRGFYRGQNELEDTGTVSFRCTLVYGFCGIKERFPPSQNMFCFVVVQQGKRVGFDVFVLSQRDKSIMFVHCSTNLRAQFCSKFALCHGGKEVRKIICFDGANVPG